MKLKIAQVVGLNTDQKAAQVISSSRDNDNTFLAVLDLTSDDAFTKGRQVLSELSDFYFDLEATSASEKLTATFAETDKKFPTEEFSLLLGAISGKILYLIHIGSVEVYLQRSDKLSSLLSVGTPKQLISGFLEEGDRLFLSTKSLVTFLGEDLDKSLKLPLPSFEEEITDRMGVSNLENQGLAALLLDCEQSDIELSPLHQADKSLDQGIETSLSNESSLLKKTLGRLLSFVWQKKNFPKSGRSRLLIAIILIVIIVLGIGAKVKMSKDAKKQVDFNQDLQQARDDFNAAKGLSTLNPAEAKSKLDQAKKEVNLALNLKPKDSQAQDLKKQIEDQSGSILQQVQVSDFPLFLDLDLIKKNFRASQVSLSNGKILLLDPTAKTLIAIDLSKKSNQILAGSEQLGDANLSSLNGGLAFIYSKDKGVLRVDATNKKVITVSKKDNDLGEIKDIYGFAGNIYIVDSGKNQIWKYLPTSEGYSDKREYFSKNTKADLTNILRMQIESSVYLLKGGGEILRFTKGDKDNFSLSGLPSNIKEPKSFFVSSDTDNLYLLDSGNSRLLVLTKTGIYKSQMSGDKFAQATDLVVDEQGKKIYLLDGGKIYSVELK